jgi:hypothetical protein
MLRNIIAAVAGVLVATLVIFVAETIGHGVFPTPSIESASCADPATYKDKGLAAACVAALPLGAKLAVVAGWFLGVVAGGIAALLVGKRWAPLAWIVAATIFLLCVVNFASMPHPVWMMVGAVFSALIGGWLAIKFVGAPARAMPATPTPKM